MIPFDELTEEEQIEFADSMGEFFADGLRRDLASVKMYLASEWDKTQGGDMANATDAWNNRADLE